MPGFSQSFQGRLRPWDFIPYSGTTHVNNTRTFPFPRKLIAQTSLAQVFGRNNPTFQQHLAVENLSWFIAHITLQNNGNKSGEKIVHVQWEILLICSTKRFIHFRARDADSKTVKCKQCVATDLSYTLHSLSICMTSRCQLWWFSCAQGTCTRTTERSVSLQFVAVCSNPI